jgi:hypothetical protein
MESECRQGLITQAPFDPVRMETCEDVSFAFHFLKNLFDRTVQIAPQPANEKMPLMIFSGQILRAALNKACKLSERLGEQSPALPSFQSRQRGRINPYPFGHLFLGEPPPFSGQEQPFGQ